MLEATRLRVRRLWLAIGSSSLAKLASIGVQIVAIPIAVSALGTEAYGVFISLTSVLGWISLVDLGVGPGLVLGLSRANGASAELQRAALVNVALFMTLAFALIVAALSYAASSVWTVEQLFGSSYESYAFELSTAAKWMMVLVLLQLVLSPVESIRAGYQEQHVSNLLQIIGGVGSGLALIIVAHRAPSIGGMVIALYGPTVFCKLLNLALLFRTRPHLLPFLRQPDLGRMRHLLATGGTFTLVQLGSLLEQYGVLFLVGRMVGPREVAEFGVMVKLVSLLAGGALMITQSLWPAYADAMARREWEWISKVYRITLYGCLVAAGAACLGGGFLGVDIVSAWTRGEIVPTRALCLTMAGVLAVGIWTHVHYMTLVGMGELRGPSLVMCLRGIVALVLAYWLIPELHGIGAGLSLFIADAVVAASYLYWRTCKTLANLRSSENAVL